MSSPEIKNISVYQNINQGYDSARPARQEGRAHVTNARWDAVDADVAKTSATEAYGKVVWSWRPVAGVKFLRRESVSGATVARKPVHRGEHDISRKAIAQGRPDALR